MMRKMTKMDHIGLYVSDLERSVKFYGDLFGFPVHRRLEMGETKIAFLDIGEGLLELVYKPESPGRPAEGRWAHVAYHVEDYDGIVSKLEGKGIPLDKRALGDGSRIAFFKDPDGHDVEISESPFNQ